MNKQDIIRKLTSRKLWISIVSFVTLILVATGHTENEATQIASIIMAGATVLGYVIGEGLVDASNIGPIDVEFAEDSEDDEDAE